MTYLAEIFLAFSLACNFGLVFLLRKNEKKTLSIEAEDLLHAMLNNKAVVRIVPLDTTQIMLRSPRS